MRNWSANKMSLGIDYLQYELLPAQVWFDYTSGEDGSTAEVPRTKFF